MCQRGNYFLCTYQASPKRHPYYLINLLLCDTKSTDTVVADEEMETVVEETPSTNRGRGRGRGRGKGKGKTSEAAVEPKVCSLLLIDQFHI